MITTGSLVVIVGDEDVMIYGDRTSLKYKYGIVKCVCGDSVKINLTPFNGRQLPERCYDRDSVKDIDELRG